MTKFKIYVLRKNFKNPIKILRRAIFICFFKQILLAKMFIRFPQNWRQKIQLIFYFQMIPSFLRNVKFLFNCFKKSKKLNFPGKNLSSQKFPVKTPDIFFLVTYLVDKTSSKIFLKSLKNHTIFKFSSLFLTHCIAPLLIDLLEI